MTPPDDENLSAVNASAATGTLTTEDEDAGPHADSGDGETSSDPAASAADGQAEDKIRLNLSAEIEDAGPCRKHVKIRIPEADMSRLFESETDELGNKADVPGFRRGHVPRKLIEKRFRQELVDQVKQKVLIASLEQVAEQHELDPINEPDIDVEGIDIPRGEDFEYEFEVEVRPDFALPDYQGLEIQRQVREITEADVEAYRLRFLSQYSKFETREGPAQPGDSLTLSAKFEHGGRILHKLNNLRATMRPVLRFTDAELTGFDKLMSGVIPGEKRKAAVAFSTEAEPMELRGETIDVEFTVKDVKRLSLPDMTKEFLRQIGVESEDQLREKVRDTIENQTLYQQRQAVRKQVLEKITESADWELPESLVLRQVENALRREVLEMQQAGFTVQQIRSRENEIRQRAISTTRRALKEHFVLDKIANQENIEVTPSEIEDEIHLMALQSGESPRRFRARLSKSGMDENLEAQIRERKAVDIVLQSAKFEDVPAEPVVEDQVEAVSYSVCGLRSEAVEPEEGKSAESQTDQ